jgi:hypothetical protein
MINTFEDSVIVDLTLESNGWRDDFEYDSVIRSEIDKENI